MRTQGDTKRDTKNAPRSAARRSAHGTGNQRDATPGKAADTILHAGRPRKAALCSGMLAPLLLALLQAPSPGGARPVTIEVTPRSAAVRAGDTLRLRARVLDAAARLRRRFCPTHDQHRPLGCPNDLVDGASDQE